MMCSTFVTFLRDNISLLTTSLYRPAGICSFAHVECSREKELILKYPAEGMAGHIFFIKLEVGGTHPEIHKRHCCGRLAVLEPASAELFLAKS